MRKRITLRRLQEMMQRNYFLLRNRLDSCSKRQSASSSDWVARHDKAKGSPGRHGEGLNEMMTFLWTCTPLSCQELSSKDSWLSCQKWSHYGVSRNSWLYEYRLCVLEDDSQKAALSVMPFLYILCWQYRRFFKSRGILGSWKNIQAHLGVSQLRDSENIIS